MLKKLIPIVCIILLSGVVVAQPTCNLQVQTYPASCHNAFDGKAELWKDGQLVVVNPTTEPLVCATPEQPNLTCDAIPAGAVENTQTSGEVVLNNQIIYLTSDFSGDFKFSGGGTVVICRNAQIQNFNINTTEPIALLINGNLTVNAQNLNLQSHISVTNYGSFTVQGAGFNGNFFNHGKFTCHGDFSINSSSGLLYNTDSLVFNQSFNISNSAVFTNNGSVSVQNTLHNNGSGSIINNCTITVGNNFLHDAPTMNNGSITVNNNTTFNSNIYKGASGSLLTTKDFINNTTAEGIGNTCASIKVANSVLVNGSGRFTGTIDLCRGSGTYTNNGLIESPATANCSCTPSVPSGGTGSTGGQMASINWSSGMPTLFGSTVTGLPAGTYSVIVALEGCAEDTLDFSITEPTAVVATAALNNKVATVITSGGNDNAYTYKWSDEINERSVATRDFMGMASGTYCVTVEDSKGCKSNSACVVVNNEIIIENDCRVSVEYLAGNLIYVDGQCVECPWLVITVANPEGEANATFAQPCQDSLVNVVNCLGERSTITLDGKKDGCGTTGGGCPDPLNPLCAACPNPLNPTCCDTPPCCDKALDPSCGTTDSLQIDVVETPPACGLGGRAVLTISGGSGKYETSNPVTNDHGLTITGLPVGETVITVRDVEKGIVEYKTVVIPEAPVATVEVINSANPLEAVNTSFSLQITNAGSGFYDVELGVLAPYQLKNLTATAGTLTVGPISLPATAGNGPFPVKVTDQYCKAYDFTVYRSQCLDATLDNFTPSVTVQSPSFKGETDGMLTLANLPAGYNALWSGKGITGTKEGAAVSGLGAGTYQLLLQNTTTLCMSSPYTFTLVDGKTIDATLTLVTSGTCKQTISAAYKDATGTVLPGALMAPVQYLWTNPLTDEPLATTQEYDVSSLPLFGRPTYLKVQVKDGLGNVGKVIFRIPKECYPTVCHPSDPTCPCPNPNNPNCTSGLSIDYTATGAKCAQPSVVQLTVNGGVNNNYRTSNLINDDTDLRIEGLPSGAHTITVYDLTTQLSATKRVVVPEPVRSEISVLNNQNPAYAVNNSFELTISEDLTGPYSIQFEGFSPYNVPSRSAIDGSLGTYELPQTQGNGPFTVTVTDSYCNNYPFTVFRREIYCEPTTASLNYVPQVIKNIPSSAGQYDGSLTLANLPLPDGAIASWTGTGFVGSRTGTSISGLPAGSYQVVIRKEAEGCVVWNEANNDFVLTDGPSISNTLSLSVSGQGCSYTINPILRDASGNLLPLPSGLSYEWVNPFTGLPPIATSQTLDISSLTLVGNPTTLKVRVRQGNLVSAYSDFILPTGCVVPPVCAPIKLEYRPVNPQCASAANGEIHIISITGDYITWITPSIIQGDAYQWDKTGLAAETYKVQVHRSGCVNPVTFTIGLVAPLPFDISYETLSPNGARLTVENGTAPYNYQWLDQNESTTENERTDLVPGTNYTVDVTDVKGCTGRFSFLYDPCAVNKPQPFVVYDKKINRATVIANGGIAPYTYFWESDPLLTNQYGRSKTGLANTTYTITVTDEQDCEGTATYTHPGCGDSLDFFTIDSTKATNSETCDGTATLVFEEGINLEDYVILWDETNLIDLLDKPNGLRAIRDRSTVKIINACSGSHEVFVFQGECGRIEVFSIGTQNVVPPRCENSDLTIDAFNGTTLDKPCGGETMDLEFGVTGGKKPYYYDWEFVEESSNETFTRSSTQQGFTDPKPGSYTVVVRDALGCTATESFTVTGASALLTSKVNAVQPTCAQGFGEAHVTITSGNGGEVISWTDEPGNTSFDRTDLVGTKTYTYQMVDAKGCTTAGSVTIKDVVVIPSLNQAEIELCTGRSLTLVARYYPQYDIQWSSLDVNIANPQADMLPVDTAGTYTLTRTHTTNPANCPALVESVTILEKTDCEPTTQVCESFTYEIPERLDTDECTTSLQFEANASALRRFDEYLEAVKRDFREQYRQSVMDSLEETLTMSFTDKEQHYTLYYYDRVGNLVSTVPPEGVRALTPQQTAAVENYWLTAETNPNATPPNVYTQHTLATTYTYNSLNQLVAQDVPDNNQQDLWQSEGSYTLLGGQMVATLDANSNTIWSFANDANQAYLYTSTDGGESFTSGLNLNLGDLNDIQRAGFTGEMYYAVGTGGLLLKASNGAANWSVLQGPTRNNLIKVHFFDTNKGYIVEETGILWKTEDGGQNWSPVTTAVQFLTTQLGSLSTELSGKTIADIRIIDNQWYVTANTSDGAGEVYVSGDCQNVPQNLNFVKQDLTITNADVVVFDGVNTEVIRAPYVFRKTANNTLVYHRSLNVSGTITKYVSNGQVHVAKTTTGLYMSSDGSNFTAVGNGFSANAQLVNSNGRIVMYEGTTASRVNNSGTLTALVTNNTQVTGYYFDGTNDYFSLNSQQILNATANLTYNLSTNNIYYIKSFVVEGNVLLVNDDNNLYPLRMSMTTGTPAQPTTVLGTVVQEQFVEIKRIGTAFYGITAQHVIKPITITNTTTPTISVSNTPLRQTAQSYQYGYKSFAFGSSPDSYTYIDNNNRTYHVINGAAPIELKPASSAFFATSKGTNSGIYTTSENGIIFKHLSNENRLSFEKTNTTANLIKATQSSDGLLRLAGSDNKLYRLNVMNETLELNEDVATLTSPVKSMHTNYLLTQSGGVYQRTGNSWNSENVTLTGYNVINAATPIILAAGNSAAISYKIGISWNTAANFKVAPIADAATNGNKLVAVGKAGTIIQSTNAGESFTKVFAPNTTDITRVALKGNGFVIGNASGAIYNYADGTTYTLATINGSNTANQPINQLYTDAQGNSWALRGNELLLSSPGTNYTVQLTATETLHAFTVDSDGYGYLVGDGGTAYRIVPSGVVEQADQPALAAINIGTGKQAKKLPTDNNITDDQGTGIPPANLRSVQFTDRLQGYISGTGGLVLKTTDGGYHWQPEGQFSNNSSHSPLLSLNNQGEGVYSDVNTLGTVNDQSQHISSRFWYDQVGRLVLSQNAKQYNIEQYLGETQYQNISVAGSGKIHAYSYTIYDDLNRVSEVGELLTRATLEPHHHESQVAYNYFQNTFIPTGKRVQVTKTYYDRAVFTTPDNTFAQENLRPRVASVAYYEQYSGDQNSYNRATHYSYDVHGNVKSLLQEIGTDNGLLSKRLDYEFDLISGNVKQVAYQAGQEDAFYHKYSYDADNRITEVETSTDNVIWKQDASYQYYAHGPLAKVITGENVENCDYAYSIHGWLKGVKGNNFSYALGYYNGDYTSIGTNELLNTPTATNLYNGNITTMTTHTPAFAQEGMPTTFTKQFKYDQLNRIKESKVIGGINVNTFKTSYSYDANGNIESLNRYDKNGVQFDAMAYNYHQVDKGYLRNTNRLRWVDDDPNTAAVHEDDIEDQSRDNYDYDDIGNLIADVSEEIEKIEWTTYGKVHAVKRTAGSSLPNLFFNYDAMGNRVEKRVVEAGKQTITYYLRDATGNVMSIYQKEDDTPLAVKEHHMYGANRIGIYYASTENAVATIEGNISKSSNEIGLKSYELNDHLGSVRVVLLDRLATSNYDNVLAANEYFPFGMIAQSIERRAFRAGFNGMERDDKLKGKGNSYDFGARILDVRLGRWLSLDPLAIKYPAFSPYNFVANNPVIFIDPDGKKIKGVKYNQKTGEIKISKSAIKRGTDKFISALQMTNKGEEVLIAMLKEKRKVKVSLTNKPLVAYIPGANGEPEYKLIAGVTDANSIAITTSKKGYDDLKEGDNEMIEVTLMSENGDFVDGQIKKEYLTEWINEEPSEYEKDYEEGYIQSGAEDYFDDSYNLPDSDLEDVHNTGIHEGTHWLNKHHENDNVTQSEKEAFEAEIEGSKEYIQTYRPVK